MQQGQRVQVTVGGLAASILTVAMLATSAPVVSGSSPEPSRACGPGSTQSAGSTLAQPSSTSAQPAATWTVSTVAMLAAGGVGGGLAVTGDMRAIAVYPDDTRVMTSRTRDGGTTWTAPASIGHGKRGVEAVAVTSRGQTVDVAYGYVNRHNTYGVRYRHSTNGGRTWGPTVPVPFGRAFPDQVVIARGPDGLVAIAAWLGVHLVVSVSTDGGRSFGSKTLLTTHQSNGCVYETGELSVAVADAAVLVSYERRSGRLRVVRSTDDGVTWGAPIALSNATDTAFNQLAVSGSDVIAMFDVGSGTAFRRSHNDGLTWGTAVHRPFVASMGVLRFDQGRYRLVYVSPYGHAKYRQSWNGLRWSPAEAVETNQTDNLIGLGVGALAGRPIVLYTDETDDPTADLDVAQP
jgi:hypothetical protein